MDNPPDEEQDDVLIQVPLPVGVEHEDNPCTQHWLSDAPGQYPAIEVPPDEAQEDVLIQVPVPEGVEHDDDDEIQH